MIQDMVSLFLFPPPPKTEEEEAFIKQKRVIVAGKEGLHLRDCGCVILDYALRGVFKGHCMAGGHVRCNLQPTLLNAVLVKRPRHWKGFDSLPLLRGTRAEDWEASRAIENRFVEDFEESVRREVGDSSLIRTSHARENSLVLQSSPGMPADKIFANFIRQANDLRELVILR